MLREYIGQQLRGLLDTATEIQITVSSTQRKPYSNDYEKVELADFTIKIPGDVKQA